MPYLNIEHVLADDQYNVSTDLNSSGVVSCLQTFLQMQIGQGADKRKPNEKLSYCIKLRVDLTDDTFYVTDDCNNHGLRDGILMCLLKKISDKSNKVSFN